MSAAPGSRRIALFGGTFDPPHNAHLALARLALDELQLDELRWVLAGQPWQKTRAVTAAAQREAMVRLAMAAAGPEPRFRLERCELEREGPSYTLDTVRELQAAGPAATWFLLIGADQYASLHTWRDWPELLSRVNLAVAQRPGVLAQPDAALLQFPHRAVALPMMDISSTEIRAQVARGEPVAELVPAEVARYIDQHALYSASSAR